MIDFDQQPPRRQIEPVVPLINVVFLLLVFFLLAGTLSPSDPVDVALPKGEIDDKSTAKPISLYMEGFVWFEKKVMEAKLVPTMLSKELADVGADGVTIKADAKAPAAELLILMEGLRAAGIEEVTLLTERGDE